jgi:hypothetical protein
MWNRTKLSSYSLGSLINARNKPPLVTGGLGVAGLSLLSLIGLYLRGESNQVLLFVGVAGLVGLSVAFLVLFKLARGPNARRSRLSTANSGQELLLTTANTNNPPPPTTSIIDHVYVNQSFTDAAARGFTSSTFDLSENIDQTDSRLMATKELESIMQQDSNLSFDEARVELTRRQMIRNDIDPDTGMPLDNKLVAW